MELMGEIPLREIELVTDEFVRVDPIAKMLHGLGVEFGLEFDILSDCISLARIDFARRGLNPTHTHPRGTHEVLVVLTGRTSTSARFTPEMFSFFLGVLYIHFQLNVSKTNAIALDGLSSQNPGVITTANAVSGSDRSTN
uniref:Germin-like protein subfamily 1 member 7 n=1 Tax=Nicotiana tabacum TaxID=4097 RepID=A0A1S4B990_TOBAC|nr:PREDICTED: germin-like protein subfamily 1 member 7 [Nicotiana tabacum]